jgi:hypothetical protein
MRRNVASEDVARAAAVQSGTGIEVPGPIVGDAWLCRQYEQVSLLILTARGAGCQRAAVATDLGGDVNDSIDLAAPFCERQVAEFSLIWVLSIASGENGSL